MVHREEDGQKEGQREKDQDGGHSVVHTGEGQDGDHGVANREEGQDEGQGECHFRCVSS